ncbi:MAG: ribosome-binding factor A, partial [Alphaproteobacteria bacterium]
MGRGDTRPRGQRQLRVGELIRHALAQSLERGEAH